MSGLTTEEILEKLKEKKSKPKIILLTDTRYSKDEKEELFRIGNIVDYLIKPFNYNELINAVKKHSISIASLH